MEPALPALTAPHFHERRPGASGPACLAMGLTALGALRTSTRDAVEVIWRVTTARALDPEDELPGAPNAAGLALAALRRGLHVSLHGSLPEGEVGSLALEAGLLVAPLEDAMAVIHRALQAGHPVLVPSRERGERTWRLVVNDSAMGLELHDPLDASGPLQVPREQLQRDVGVGPLLELAPGIALRR